MENHELMSIDLLEIVIFLKAADSESFSKTAKELGITTSMVSKHIVSLENALGWKLFDRKSSRVYLTSAGRSLATDWRSLYDSFLFSIEKASRAAQLSEEPVCIGIGSPANSDRFLVPMLNAYDMKEEKTNVRVELRRNFDLIDDLLRGTFDIIFLPYFMLERIEKESRLDSFTALKHPLVVGMASENPLTLKETIHVSDLKQCRIILAKRPSLKEYEIMINKLCTEEGFQPRIDPQFVEDIDSAYLNVSGDRVFIADRLYRQIDTNAAVYRNLEGTQSGLLMVWKKNPSEKVLHLIHFAQQFLSECG